MSDPVDMNTVWGAGGILAAILGPGAVGWRGYIWLKGVIQEQVDLAVERALHQAKEHSEDAITAALADLKVDMLKHIDDKVDNLSAAIKSNEAQAIELAAIHQGLDALNRALMEGK